MTSIEFRSFLPAALPHLIAVAVMFFAASMLFSPSVFDGKHLNQGDITNNVGMSKEARDLQRKDGEIPQWTDSMFGGMPTTQITGTDIGTAPKFIWLAIRKAMPMEVGTVLMAMISAYVLGLCLGLSPWLALILGLGFGLSSLNVLYLAAGHATKVRAIATMPGVVAGVMLAFRGRMWAGAGVAAFFAALHLEADHVQMTYYLLYLLGAIAVGAWVHAAVKGTLMRAAQTSGVLLLAGLLSALPQTGQLALTEQYSEFTTRGKANVAQENGGSKDMLQEGLNRDYILEYSMARGEFWSIAIPDVKGGNNQLYWGEQRFSGGAFYFGALAFALFLAWLIAGSSWLRWPLLAVSLLAVVLSWRDATSLTEFFLDHVPLFNKFRDTKMMLVLVQLAIPTGAAMALHEMSQPEAAKNWKRWAVGGAAATVLMLAFYLMPKVWFDFTSSIRPDLAMEQLGKRVVGMRVELFREDVMRSLAFSVVALLLTLALVKRWTQAQWVALGAVVLVAADLLSVDGRYLNDSNYVAKLDKRFPFEATAADRVILANERQAVPDFDDQWASAKERWEDQLDIKLTRRYSRIEDAAAFEVLNANTHFRVFDLANPFNDARTSYFHKSVGGYHGAKLRRYQEFIERILTDERAAVIQAIQSGRYNLDASVAPGLAMLNTRYFLIPGAEQPLPFAGGLGPAWFVDEVRYVDSPEEELDGVASINPKTTALVHREFEGELGRIGRPGNSSAVLKAYHPEGSTYEVQSEGGGLLLLSEVHYPIGWTATVDGEETPLVRVNALLMGLEVPAGSHEVSMSFEPEGWGTARGLSRAGSLVWMALLALCFWQTRRESNGRF
jgi:hypothetical protein